MFDLVPRGEIAKRDVGSYFIPDATLENLPIGYLAAAMVKLQQLTANDPEYSQYEFNVEDIRDRPQTGTLIRWRKKKKKKGGVNG